MENKKKIFISRNPGKDQALALLRDNEQSVLFYANYHPDKFVRLLGQFAICEMKDNINELLAKEEEDAD